jgi:hypothetical protein
VSEFAWQENGKLLARHQRRKQDGQRRPLFDPGGSLRVSSTSSTIQSRVAASSDLAALRSAVDTGHAEPAQAILAWTSSQRRWFCQRRSLKSGAPAGAATQCASPRGPSTEAVYVASPSGPQK